MADNEKLAAAKTHVLLNNQRAETARSNVGKKASLSAATAWYLVQLGIERAEETRKINAAWNAATESEDDAIKSEMYARDGIRFREKGDDNAAMSFMMNANKMSSHALFSLARAAFHLDDPNASKYYAMYRRSFRKAPNLNRNMDLYIPEKDKSSEHNPGRGSRDLEEYNPGINKDETNN